MVDKPDPKNFDASLKISRGYKFDVIRVGVSVPGCQMVNETLVAQSPKFYLV